MNTSVNWSTNCIGVTSLGEATREAPAQTELRPTSAGAFRVILPCDVTPMNTSVDWSTNCIGGDVTGEATREAPAQTELRPTSAGAFRVILPCDVTPMNPGRLVDQYHKGRRNKRGCYFARTPSKSKGPSAACDFFGRNDGHGNGAADPAHKLVLTEVLKEPAPHSIS